MTGLPQDESAQMRCDWASVTVLEQRAGRWVLAVMNWSAGGLSEMWRTRPAGLTLEQCYRMGR